MSMISEACAHIHNYFEDDPVTGERMIYQGHYKIENGSITLPFMKPGQYIRIFGSELNDGVYKYPVEPAEGEESPLQDEEFDGVIWKMRPPNLECKTKPVTEISRKRYKRKSASYRPLYEVCS